VLKVIYLYVGPPLVSHQQPQICQLSHYQPNPQDGDSPEEWS
jgi:hypothetical protein